MTTSIAIRKPVFTEQEFTREGLEVNRRFNDVTRNGVVYDGELQGRGGMSYVLLREPHTTDAMLSDAIEQLQSDHDVVGSIKVTAVIPYWILAQSIGTTFTTEDWPTNDLDGLIKALKQWTLGANAAMHGEDPDHPHVEFEAPYRGLAWSDCIEEPIPGQYRRRFVGTRPIYPEHPKAVRFCGNFEKFSFGWSLDTDDQSLIKLLDELIAANMATPAYQAALRTHLENQAFWHRRKR